MNEYAKDAERHLEAVGQRMDDGRPMAEADANFRLVSAQVQASLAIAHELARIADALIDGGLDVTGGSAIAESVRIYGSGE